MDDNDIMEPETLAEQFIELGIDTSIEVTIYLNQYLWFVKCKYLDTRCGMWYWSSRTGTKRCRIL